MTKKKVQNLLKHLVCILLCLTVILPFYMVVINSFKSKGEASRMSLALPKEWLFSNYTEVIDKGNLIQGFSNSLLYALVATTFGVVLCAMAAFVMCRKRTRLNVFLYYFVLCGLFFPVNYVTLVRVLSTLHLNDTQKQTLAIGDKVTKLTTKECELLSLLCAHANEILERNYALKTIWVDDNYFNARSMDVYITKLRKLLKDDPGIEIINIHGKGYKLITPSGEEQAREEGIQVL